MTSLIDIQFEPDHHLLRKYPKSPLSCASYSITKETSKKVDKQTQLNSFVIHDQHRKYDLLFDVDFVSPQTVVKVFLLSKQGHIQKTSSDISKVQLIKNFFDEKQFYRPCVNPLTGLIYFKIDFFTVGKKRAEFERADKVEWALKGIDMQKLFLSVNNLQNLTQKLEFKQCKNWYNEEQKYRFATVKTVARTLQKQNVFQGIQQKTKTSLLQQKQNPFKSNQFGSFFETQKLKNPQVDPRRIKQTMREVEKVHPHLSTFIKTKSRRSNFDQLFVSESTRTKIFEQMKTMMQSNIDVVNMKLNQTAYENALLKLEKLAPSEFDKKREFLNSLNKNFEYDQIERYFDSQTNIPVQISLETRCENLKQFLQKNDRVISLETKMRILVQIYTFVNTLWEENELIFLMNPDKVFLTKKLSVKMRGLDSFFKPEKEMIWEEIDTINKKRSESLLNISSFFFKLFYKRNLLYMRPRRVLTAKRSIYDRYKTMGLDKLNFSNNLPKDVSEKTKEFLTALNYLFTEQVSAASKTIKKLNRKEAILRKRQNAEDSDESTNGSDEDYDEVVKFDDEEGILNTKFVACWLLKNM